MLHTVAKLHYKAELSQIKIAQKLGVSTATVSRLLQRARSEGIVRIEVPDLISPGALEAALSSRLGLRRVSVVDAPEPTLPVALAGALSAILKEQRLGAGSVLAIGWGRAIRSVVANVLPPLPGVQVVPATGGLQQQAAHFQINEFVRTAAAQFGGTPFFLHAPYLPSVRVREALLTDPSIRDSLALWEQIDVAVVGIGLPHAQNPPEASVATPNEQLLVTAAGDVIRHYFDADGGLVPWEGEERMMAVSVDQLRAAPLSIGVATSAAKAGAILGAVRAKLINGLVTDVRAAEQILIMIDAKGDA